MVNEITRLVVRDRVVSVALHGKHLGDTHFPILLGAILDAAPDTTVILDFSGIESVTASYVAATIVRLLRMQASGSLERYLSVEHLAASLRDELEYVLRHEKSYLLVLNADGTQQVIGDLDTAYVVTFREVQARGIVTARELQTASEEDIGHTGWTKRLATLHTLGLVRRQKNSREFAYTPVLHTEELNGRRFR